jgi:hypothetical protein
MSPQPGMALINLAKEKTPLGEPIMSDSELAVFVSNLNQQGSQEAKIGTGTLTETGAYWRT